MRGERKLAVWYHACLESGQPAIDFGFGKALVEEQMASLQSSGLAAAADECFICFNGGERSEEVFRSVAPKTATLVEHGTTAASLLPTVDRLAHWLADHPDWLVCFFHAKGITHPNDELTSAWRGCMERCVIVRWQQCVDDLIAGADTVGAHWLSSAVFPTHRDWQNANGCWGGMFFWATAKFLSEIPRLPSAPNSPSDWFLPENWIGMGRVPQVKDYAPHWPGLNECRSTP